MKKLMILLFVLFVGVAGFSTEEVCNDFGVENDCVDARAAGGDIDIFQGFQSTTVVVSGNEGYSGSVLVLNDGGQEVFFESFKGDAAVSVNYLELGAGGFTLIAKAGTNVEKVRFIVESE